jgi:hypothetical protein
VEGDGGLGEAAGALALGVEFCGAGVEGAGEDVGVELGGCPCVAGGGVVVEVAVDVVVLGDVVGAAAGVVVTVGVVVGAAGVVVVTPGVVAVLGPASAIAAVATVPDEVATATPAVIATRQRRVRTLMRLSPHASSTAATCGSSSGARSGTGTRPSALNVKNARGPSTIWSGTSNLITQSSPLSDCSSSSEPRGRCTVRVRS